MNRTISPKSSRRGGHAARGQYPCARGIDKYFWPRVTFVLETSLKPSLKELLIRDGN